MLPELLDFLSSDGDTLGAILVILAVTATLNLLGQTFTLLGRIVLVGLDRLLARCDRRRQMQEVLVDVLIDADFDKRSVTQITDANRIASLKRAIHEAKGDFRPYVLSFREDPTFEDYRSIPGLSLLRFGRGSDEFEHECILPSGAFQLSSH